VPSLADSGNDPVETDYTEQISVTAARTPIPLSETGNSVSILTREQIEERGHVFLSELLRGLPGLSISRSGPMGSQTQIRARGAEANHVLVQIDGVDVSDVFGADELPLEIMTSDDIERIEFVRGPQSGLWGSDAVAGVINIVTRSSRVPGISARLEGGSFGTSRAAGRYAYGNDRVRFDANVSHLDTAGTNVSRQGFEDDGTRSTTAAASVRFVPSTPLTVELAARHIDSSSDFDAVDFVTTGLPVDALNTTETDLTIIRLSGRWHPEDGRWTHQATLSSVSSDTQTELGGTPDSSTTIDKFGVSLQSSIYLGVTGGPGKHELAFAVDHERRDFGQTGVASPFGDPNQNQDALNTGVAFEYRFRTKGNWAASANVRQESNSDFDDITTFRLTASTRLGSERTRLRGAIGTGQKAPTFVERFGFFPGSFVGNPNLQPEQSTSFEIGIDRQLWRSGKLGITYFNATLEDEINGFFFDAIAGAFTAVNETGESDRQGFELEFLTPIGDRLDFQTTYTFTDATQPGAGGGSERELRRPRHLGSLAVTWRSEDNHMKIRSSVNHIGASTDLFFPPFPTPSQRVELDGYWLADLNASFRVAPRLDLLGRVDNLFDETYEDVFGFRASGIGAYLGVSFRSDGR
jgi:vitamin B12 transporter